MLSHNLPVNPGVFYCCETPLTREAFEAIYQHLDRTLGKPERGYRAADLWEAIERRKLSRWDRIVPRYDGPTDSIEGWQKREASRQSVPSMIRARGYDSFLKDGVRYVLDLVNPENELELPFPWATKPVIAIFLEDAEFPRRELDLAVRDRLVGIDSFQRTVEGMCSILGPRSVCGGAFLHHALLRLCALGTASEVNPWDLLWTLTIVDLQRLKAVSESALDRNFVLYGPVCDGRRVLLQVMPGFDGLMGEEYTRAASLVGMTAVTDI